WSKTQYRVLCGRSFAEMTNDTHLLVDKDWTLNPQMIFVLARLFSGAILLNTNNGEAVIVNTVEAYARTLWLDAHHEPLKTSKGIALETSLPGVKGKDRYKGFRPITMNSGDGCQLVIGASFANLLVTSSLRLDNKNVGSACSVGGITASFVISSVKDSQAIRIYLDEESIEAARALALNTDSWGVQESAIVYQLRQLRTKFHEASTFMFCRASGPLTNLHPFMPYTVFTIFD
ncbi:hypothetical protein BCR41DRAFT_296274, partial [Lobosporangium transversale]